MKAKDDLQKKHPQSLSEMDFQILCQLESENFAQKALLMTEALNQEDLKKGKTIN